MLKHVAIVVFLIVAAAVFIFVGNYASRHGVDRSPEKQFLYSIPDGLTDKTKRYVVPVLFPLDLIVMVLLSGSLALASMTWGSYGLGGRPWLFLILPLAYLVFDLIEDSLLILVLTGSLQLGGVLRVVLQWFTAGKMITLVMGGIQTILAAGAAVLRSISA